MRSVRLRVPGRLRTLGRRERSSAVRTTGIRALWVLPVLTLVVAVSSAWLISGFANAEALAYQNRVELAHLVDLLHVEEATSHELLLSAGARPFPAGQGASLIATERGRVSAALAEIGATTSGSRVHAQIIPLVTGYQTALDAEMAAVARGETARALAVHHASVDPAFNRLQGGLAQADRTELAAARRAAAETRVGIYGVQLAGALGLGLVTVLLGRARVRGAVLAAEQATLTTSEERFRTLVHDAADVVAVVDPCGGIGYVSDSAAAVLGYTPAVLVGRRWMDIVHPDDLDTVVAAFDGVLTHPGSATIVESRLRHGDGSWRFVETSVANRLAVPVVAGIVLTIRDVTDRRRLTDELAHQALHDALTGLANRALLTDRLDQGLARAARGGGPLALVMIDLDDFKEVNDTLGHGAGDQLLVSVARRLRGHVRPSDTVARLGGDEFVLVMEGTTASQAERRIARFLDTLTEPVLINDRAVVVGASAGVVISSGGQEGADELLRQADVALYTAKDRGHGSVVRYEPGMQAA
ncbi:MAG: diguanylate cyclase domain-containing protein, partial [Actinomycetes bacterium]